MKILDDIHGFPGRIPGLGKSDDEARDYRVYRLTARDIAREASKGVGLAALISYTFYKSFAIFFILAPAAALVLPVVSRKSLGEKERWELTKEFREGIWIMSGFMNAGLSPENAVIKAIPELRKLFGERAMIVGEFERIEKGIGVNIPMERLFTNFGQRSGVKDIQNFAEVFALVKRSGGHMRETVEKTTDIIRDKTFVTEEIKNMTASRRYEQKIMNIMPFLLILYINAASGDFLDCMYTGFAGRLIMSLSLLLIGVSYILSQKILDIRI